MKIAFLTPEYPHAKTGGAGGIGTSIKNLAFALLENKVKVTIFIYGQDQSEVFVDDDIEFHRIANKNFTLGKWFFYRKHIQNYCNNVIKSENIDLVEVADWTGVTAFMRFKVPLIIRFHGSDTYFCHLEKRPQKLKNRFLETLAVRNAQGYVAPTKFTAELSASLFGLKRERIKVIYNGISLDQFKNNNPNQFNKGVILYIGTIIRKKGVFELPEIFKKVIELEPNANLVLIGGDSNDIKTGATSTWDMVYQQFPENLKSNVTYLGKIPYTEVQNFIQRANVCVFPTYAETFGMVTIEAMAMKRPVVNSNIGWAQELMEDGKSGFLVHPSNHQEYANRIVSLLRDAALTRTMGQEAKGYVANNFDIFQLAKQNISFYQSIINKNVR